MRRCSRKRRSCCFRVLVPSETLSASRIEPSDPRRRKLELLDDGAGGSRDVDGAGGRREVEAIGGADCGVLDEGSERSDELAGAEGGRSIDAPIDNGVRGTCEIGMRPDLGAAAAYASIRETSLISGSAGVDASSS